jgi:hypothetical protein
MDIIDKGIKARRGHRHRYLHVAAEACEQRPSRDSAVPAQTANPETARSVAASSFASARESPALPREVAAPGWRLTCALGIPLRKMSNPAASPARAAAQEGGPR